MYTRLSSVRNCLFPVVHAEEKKTNENVKAQSKETSCCHAKKATQCSVYDSPHQNVEYEIVKVQAGTLEQCIRTTRQTLSTYLGSFQDANDRISQFINTGVEHTKSTYDYLTDDASTVPRIIAITVGGFSGLVLATRRGVFRKLLYGSSGALIVAAACYPKEASKISRTVIDTIKTDGFDYVQQYTGYNPRDLTQKLPELPSTESFSSILEMFNKQVKSGEKSEIQGDHGQSNPADKHMYTTRGN